MLQVACEARKRSNEGVRLHSCLKDRRENSVLYRAGNRLIFRMYGRAFALSVILHEEPLLGLGIDVRGRAWGIGA